MSILQIGKSLFKTSIVLLVYLGMSLVLPRYGYCADFNVMLGQDKTFTDYNYYFTETKAAPYHPEKGAPTILDATAAGQTAIAHVFAQTNQEGYAVAGVGVNFLAQEGLGGLQELEADITITLNYELGVDFQVPDPSVGGGGSADSIVYGIKIDDRVLLDRINFIHYSNFDARNGDRTLSFKGTFHAGETYTVFSDVYAFADIYGGGYADSLARTTIEEIKITFPAILTITDPKTDKPNYTIGEQAKISCKVTDSSCVTVSGAFVTAEITKPDSSVETILVSENQPGNYEGIFTNVSLSGTYNTTIKAQKQGYTDATPINLTFTAERNKIPLGKSTSIANPDIEFYSIYVPDRYGGDLTVTAAGGGVIGLYYPNPYTKVANAATQINYPVAFNQHGWYYVKIIDRGSISNISNTFVQTGEASYRPWNFWY